VLAPERETETVAVGDRVDEELGNPEVVGLGERLTVVDADALSEDSADLLDEALGIGFTVPAVADELGVDLIVAKMEPNGLALPERDGDTVGGEVRVAIGEGDNDGDAEVVRDAVPEREPVGVTVGERLAEMLRLDVGEVVTLREPVGDFETVALLEGEGLVEPDREGVGEPLCVAETLFVRLPVGEVVSEGDDLGETDPVPLFVGEGDVVGETEPAPLADGESEVFGEREGVGLVVPLTDSVALAVGEIDVFGEDDGLRDAEMDLVDRGDGVSVRDGGAERDAMREGEPDGVALGVLEPEVVGV
jgi:hypothetical protein